MTLKNELQGDLYYLDRHDLVKVYSTCFLSDDVRRCKIGGNND
jgi:hypothetical protein